jgi:hypothetical protein
MLGEVKQFVCKHGFGMDRPPLRGSPWCAPAVPDQLGKLADGRGRLRIAMQSSRNLARIGEFLIFGCNFFIVCNIGKCREKHGKPLFPRHETADEWRPCGAMIGVLERNDKPAFPEN